MCNTFFPSLVLKLFLLIPTRRFGNAQLKSPSCNPVILRGHFNPQHLHPVRASDTFRVKEENLNGEVKGQNTLCVDLSVKVAPKDFITAAADVLSPKKSAKSAKDTSKLLIHPKTRSSFRTTSTCRVRSHILATYCRLETCGYVRRPPAA